MISSLASYCSVFVFIISMKSLVLTLNVMNPKINAIMVISCSLEMILVVVCCFKYSLILIEWLFMVLKDLGIHAISDSIGCFGDLRI